jgi:hypothetical protein
MVVGFAGVMGEEVMNHLKERFGGGRWMEPKDGAKDARRTRGRKFGLRTAESGETGKTRQLLLSISLACKSGKPHSHPKKYRLSGPCALFTVVA